MPMKIGVLRNAITSNRTHTHHIPAETIDSQRTWRLHRYDDVYMYAECVHIHMQDKNYWYAHQKSVAHAIAEWSER